MHLHLNWRDFDDAVAALTEEYQDKPLTGIYGVPRGGLPLAVALSHRLQLPLRNAITPSTLVVDDIWDSGRTLRVLAERHGEAMGPVCVWLTREEDPVGYFAHAMNIGEYWVVFPWEDPQQAARHQLQYEESRR